MKRPRNYAALDCNRTVVVEFDSQVTTMAVSRMHQTTMLVDNCQMYHSLVRNHTVLLGGGGKVVEKQLPQSDAHETADGGTCEQAGAPPQPSWLCSLNLGNKRVYMHYWQPLCSRTTSKPEARKNNAPS
jgi:hypothetical protein